MTQGARNSVTIEEGGASQNICVCVKLEFLKPAGSFSETFAFLSVTGLWNRLEGC
jgi:hypothetical protein